MAAKPMLTGSIEQLKAAASVIHPDTKLIAACYRMDRLLEERKRIHYRKGKGYAQRLQATRPEHQALEAEIAGTPAITDAGLLAKAEMALTEMPDQGVFSFAHSALSDL